MYVNHRRWRQTAAATVSRQCKTAALSLNIYQIPNYSNFRRKLIYSLAVSWKMFTITIITCTSNSFHVVYWTGALLLSASWNRQNAPKKRWKPQLLPVSYNQQSLYLIYRTVQARLKSTSWIASQHRKTWKSGKSMGLFITNAQNRNKNYVWNIRYHKLVCRTHFTLKAWKPSLKSH